MNVVVWVRSTVWVGRCNSAAGWVRGGGGGGGGGGQSLWLYWCGKAERDTNENACSTNLI